MMPEEDSPSEKKWSAKKKKNAKVNATGFKSE